jgi:homoserine dehydrogenase
MSRSPLRVAVLGAGTVGLEVVRAFLDRPASLRSADGAPLELAGVAVRDVDRAIERGVPAALVSDGPAHLVADPGVDVVVELMGGEEPARTLVAAALSAGKSVVTANKHLIAHHGAALEGLARDTGAQLRFEAAVGGGIPVLGPIALDLAANRVAAVRGIVNGTTNFILSAMAEQGLAYADVLAAAQAAGYAEADPTGDVEGADAVNKLVILARLAFGVWLAPGGVPTRTPRRNGAAGQPGITGVTAEDIAAARAAGHTLRLIAEARRPQDDPNGSSVVAAVRTMAVPADSPLGRTGGVLNRIEVEAEPVGRVAFSGPGAGGAATSSAVLGDLVAVARDLGSTWAGRPPAIAGTPLPPPAEPAFDGPSGARYPILEGAG